MSFQAPGTPSPFEAILEDLGTARSRLGAIRTAAHAACARHHSRRASASRREDAAHLAVILGASEDPFPALLDHR